MDLDSIKEKIAKSRIHHKTLIDYMRYNSIDNPEDLKEKINKVSEDDPILFDYNEFNNLTENLQENFDLSIYIKSNNVYDDYGTDKELIDEIFILIEKSKMELLLNLEKNLSQNNLNHKITCLTAEKTKTLDDYIPTHFSADKPINKIGLDLLGEFNEEAPKLSEFNNSKSLFFDKIDLSELEEDNKYIENIENELVLMPESFIKYLKSLEILMLKILSKIKTPNLANLKIKEQLIEFSDLWIKIEDFFIKNNISCFDGAEKLKNSLKKEILENCSLGESFNLFKKLQKKIIPIDMKKLEKNYEMSIKAAEKIKEKDVLALIGNSNAGKSTTTFYLAGSEMKKIFINGQIPHIYAESFIYPELENIKTSYKALSETRYVVAFQVNYEEIRLKDLKGSIYIADLPGLFENRDVETEISNNLGVTRFLKSCKTLKILYVLNYKDMVANNCQGVRDLINIIISLVSSVKGNIDMFLFAVNKATKEEFKELKGRIVKLKEHLTEEEKNNQNFILALNKISKSIIKEGILIDPLDRSNLDEIYEKIDEMNAMKNPQDVFNLTLSPKAKSDLKEYTNSKEKIILNALENADLSLLKNQIKELSFFNEIEEMTDIQSRIKEINELIKKKLNNNYENITIILNDIKIQNNIFSLKQVEELGLNYKNIQNLDDVTNSLKEIEGIFKFTYAQKLIEDFIKDISKLDLPKEEEFDYQFLSEINKKLTNMFLLTNEIVEYQESYHNFHKFLKGEILKNYLDEYKKSFSSFKYEESYRYFHLVKNLDKIISHFPQEFSESMKFINFNLELNINNKNETELSEKLILDIKSILESNIENICEIFLKETKILTKEKIIELKDLINVINELNESRISYLFDRNQIREATEKIGNSAKVYIQKRNEIINSMILSDDKLIIDDLINDYQSLKSISEIDKISFYVAETYRKTCEILETILTKIQNLYISSFDGLINLNDEDNIFSFKKNIQTICSKIKIVEKSELLHLLDPIFKDKFYSNIKDDFEYLRNEVMNKSNCGNSISFNENYFVNTVKGFFKLSLINLSEIVTIVLKENNYDKEIINFEEKIKSFLDDQIKTFNEEDILSNLRLFKINYKKRLFYLETFKKFSNEKLIWLINEYESSLNKSTLKFKKIIFNSIKEMMDIFTNKKFTKESIENDCNIISIGYECLKEIEEIKIKPEYDHLFSILNENENYNLENYLDKINELKQYLFRTVQNNNINIDLNLLRNVIEVLLEKLVPFDQFKINNNVNLNTFSKLYNDCFEMINRSFPTVESRDKEKIKNNDFIGLGESCLEIDRDSNNPINQRRKAEIKNQLNYIIREAKDYIYNNLKLVHTDYIKENHIREIEDKLKKLNEIKFNIEKFIEFEEIKIVRDYTSEKIKILFDRMKKQSIAYFNSYQFANAENILNKLALYSNILVSVQNDNINFNEITNAKEKVIENIQFLYKTKYEIKNFRIIQPKKLFEQLNKKEITENVEISSQYNGLYTDLIDIINKKYGQETLNIISQDISINDKDELLLDLDKSTDYLPDEIKSHLVHQIVKDKNNLSKQKSSLKNLIDELILANNYQEINNKFKDNWPQDIKNQVNKYMYDKADILRKELGKIFEDFDHEKLRHNISRTYDFYINTHKFKNCLHNSEVDYKNKFNQIIKVICNDEIKYFNLEEFKSNFSKKSDEYFIDLDSSFYSQINSDSNSKNFQYLFKELIILLNEKPVDIVEKFIPDLQIQIQNCLKVIKKFLIKIDEIYQEKLREEIISSKILYKFYLKFKEIYTQITFIFNDEIKKILMRNHKDFIKYLESYKTPEDRKTEIENNYIKNYLNDIYLNLNLIQEKMKQQDKKSHEVFFRTINQKINTYFFYFSKFTNDETEYDKLNSFLIKKVEDIKNTISNICLLSIENLKEEKLYEINLLVEVLSYLSASFPHYKEDINDYLNIFISNLINNLKTERDLTLQGEFNLPKISKNMIKLQKLKSFLKFFEKEIESILTDYIDTLKTKEQPGEIFNRLGQLLQDDEEYGYEITRIYNIFDGFRNSLYKSLTEKFDIDYVLENLNIKSINENNEFINEYNKKIKDFLKEKYNEYFEEFKRLIETHLRNSEQGMINIKNQLKILIADQFDEIMEDKIIKHNIYTNLPVILAHVSAIFTINGSKNYYNIDDTKFEDKNLLIPHPAQIIAIFEIFCFDTKKSDKLKNNMVQVGTGEGKSIILGLSSIIFALLGYEVSVACYSFNLSKRDYDSFEELFNFFGVSNFIHYGNFISVLEKILNRNVNIKKYLSELIFKTNENSLAQVKSCKRFQILLFDEVDIFFSKEFHGKMYSSSLIHKHKIITELFEFIWSKRSIDSDEIIPVIKESTEYKNCKEMFNDWDKLLDESLKDILLDLYNFESHQYFAINNKIGYKDNDQVVYNIRYGYKTVFAYFKEFENGKITRESLEENIGITIKCCDFSFSEIPKMFDYIFGVSGTVEILGVGQKKMVSNEYDIKRYTILPSVFGRNNLQFNKQCNFFIENDLNNKYDNIHEPKDLASLNVFIKKSNEEGKIEESNTVENIKEEGKMKIEESSRVANLKGEDVIEESNTIANLKEEGKIEESNTVANIKDSKEDLTIMKINNVNENVNENYNGIGDVNGNIQYYYRIKEEIKKGLIGQSSGNPQRAILIFFKDVECIKKFLSLNKCLKSDFNIITEELNDKEVQDAIKAACRKNIITIATASFGRGYDFIIRDKLLNSEGGLHIIQTFLSDDMAEQIQIMGRTARQGNTGSYSLIIKYEELKNKFEITKEILDQQMCKYDYVMKSRDDHNEIIFNNNQAIIEQVKKIHTEFTKLIGYIKNNKIDEIKKQILKINRGVQFSKYIARTKIYLDATSSMDVLIDKLRYVINQIFIKLNDILKKSEIEENSFSIEIVLFRNYDVSKENILVRSGWEMKPDNLVNFLTKAECFGGWEKEAIELCLNDAAKEKKKLTNIILFSDSASNTRKTTFLKRNHNNDTYTENNMKPLDYWNSTEFKDVIDIEEELSKIKEKKIPIYGFYVENKEKKIDFRNDAENFFKRISMETEGFYEKVNVQDENEGDRLAKLISEPIINDIGNFIGDEEKRAKLIKEFEKQYI